MFGDITVESRPLRLALLIPRTKKALQRAIQVNSTLWGGTYNPIIPLYSKVPDTWRTFPHERVAVKDRVLGYIRSFDPDILVNGTGSKLPDYLASANRKVVNIDDIWADFHADNADRTPNYGIGVFELFGAIYKEYFETLRRFPYTVAFPKPNDGYDLFWSAAVGQMPTEFQTIIETEFKEALDIQRPSLGALTYKDVLEPNILFTRRVIDHHVKTKNVGWYHHDNAYGYFMDATNFQDIVAYWNLRAVGRYFLPIPKQFIEIPEFLETIRSFIKANFRVNPHNPTITYGTSIIRGHTSDMKELQKLSALLQVSNLFPDRPDARPLSLQHWYPRIWDEWAQNKDGIIPNLISSKSEEISFPETDRNVLFKLVAPEFSPEGRMNSIRYANEIYPKFYDQADDVLAGVFPYDHGPLVRTIASGGSGLMDDFRIGRTGLVYLIGYEKKARWKIPLAEEVFFAWLLDKGFAADLSPPGRLAKQIRSQMGRRVGILTNEGLLNFLEQFATGKKKLPENYKRKRKAAEEPEEAARHEEEDTRGMAIGRLKTELNNLGPGRHLFRLLTDCNVFKLGVRAKCTHCQRSSWHSIKDFADDLACPLCYRTLDVINAVDSENQGVWHLKPSGPFSVGKYADGGYSVLLGLNFFERMHSLRMTPVMSFTARNPGLKIDIEADFAFFWQETVFGETTDGVLFAECKSYNKFLPKDYARMRTIMEQFPGAVIAFCTLRKDLDSEERREIGRIAKEGTRHWKSERPINPVIVLTGTELFSPLSPPRCWADLTVPGWAQHPNTLLDLCNATQGVHLGLPHRHEAWTQASQKRQERRTKRQEKK